MDENIYRKGREPDTFNADMERLKLRVTELINKRRLDGTILEGHISHYLPADVIIVLRASPIALRKRLGKRREYSMRR